MVAQYGGYKAGGEFAGAHRAAAPFAAPLTRCYIAGGSRAHRVTRIVACERPPCFIRTARLMRTRLRHADR
jgi:hypothetical protein